MPELLEEQIELSFATAPPLDEYVDASRRHRRRPRRQLRHRVRDRAEDPRALGASSSRPYSPADLMHGPIAAIRPDWPVIARRADRARATSVEGLVPALQERGARLLVVSDVDEPARARAHAARAGPRVPEWLSPLIAVIPGR